MKSVVFAASAAAAAAALALPCTSANAALEINATWDATLYSTTDPSDPPLSLSGSVTFVEPYFGFGTYSYRDGDYEVILTEQFAHGGGDGGTDNVFSIDGSLGGPGFWSGSAVEVVPEPANAALMLAGLGLFGVTAWRSRN